MSYEQVNLLYKSKKKKYCNLTEVTQDESKMQIFNVLDKNKKKNSLNKLIN